MYLVDLPGEGESVDFGVVANVHGEASVEINGLYFFRVGVFGAKGQ